MGLDGVIEEMGDVSQGEGRGMLFVVEAEEGSNLGSKGFGSGDGVSLCEGNLAEVIEQARSLG